MCIITIINVSDLVIYMFLLPISTLLCSSESYQRGGFFSYLYYLYSFSKGFSPLNRLIGTASECFIEVFYFLTIKRAALHIKKDFLAASCHKVSQHF